MYLPPAGRIPALAHLQGLIDQLPQQLQPAISLAVTRLVKSQEPAATQVLLTNDIATWTLSYLPDLKRLEGTPAAEVLKRYFEARTHLDNCLSELAAAAHPTEGTLEEHLEMLRQKAFEFFNAYHQREAAEEAIGNAQGAFAAYLTRAYTAIEQLVQIFEKHRGPEVGSR